MIPILFHLGPFKIYSYGLMLGIGFLLGSYVLSLELRRKKLDPAMASTITVLGVVFGIARRVLVLHNGRLIADGEPRTVRANEQVQKAYLGETG